LALALALVAGASAQSGGDLTGVVYDPTGAVIPGTKVILTNVATGTVRTTETTDAGVYRFVALPVVGTYKLKVEATGFKTYEAAGIVVSVARTTTQDVKLEVGAATTTVTVEAGAELVQTSESQLSELVDRRAWQSLPLQFRDSNSFVDLLAGVVPDAFGGTTRGAAVNGLRPGSGNFMIEGFDNNDQGQGGRGAAVVAGAITSVSPEAIQEYRVVTSGFAAEYGKAAGFVNNMQIKSGTNDWHGSAFWYNRVQALAANDFFSNKNNVQDSLVRNQFGGSFGGPVIRDRTFAFGSYEGHLLRQGTPVTGTGTTQQFLTFVQSGAFRTFMETDPNGVCFQLTGATCPGAFANSATLGPIFSNLITLQNFPLATDPTTFSFNGGGPYTAGITYPVPIFGQVTDINRAVFNEQRVTFKFDHRLATNDQLSYVLNFHDHDSSGSNGGGDALIGPEFTNPGRTISTGITWQHTFTPTLLNFFKFGYLRNRSDFPNSPQLNGVPSLVTAFDPLQVALGQASALPQFFTENQFQVKNDVSKVYGAHTFKAGFDYRRTRNGSAFEAWKNGLFLPYGVEDLVTDGFFGDEADLAVLGYSYYGGFYYAQASINPTTGLRPEYYRGFRANEWAWFVQDDWKVTPHLTLNIGVRHEYFGPPHNFRRGLDSNFYFGAATTPIPVTTSNVFYPTNSPTAAQVFNGGFQQRDENIWAKDYNNFAPRIGFAYDVLGNSKFVLRGSYAISYDRMWNNLFENIRFNPPFFSNPQIGAFRSGQAAGPLSTPGLFTVPFTSFGLFAGGFSAAPSPRHMDENLVTAYSQQFFLGTQWAFAKDFVFEANYTGTLGNKLLGVVDNNTYNGRVACLASGLNAGQVAACNAAALAGQIATPVMSSRRISTAIGGDNFRFNGFRSNYHGLQLIVRKSFSSGLQFNANYTWAHAIDMLSDAFNGSRGQFLRPTNNSNVLLDRGNADFDIRHRFVVSYHYELPWLKQNRWLGGWVFSGITTLQTGVPIQLFHSGAAGDANRDGYRTDRLVYTGTGNINNAVQTTNPADGYIRAADFTTVTCPTTTNFGLWCDSPTPRNTLTGPGFANFDFSVAKNFKLTERVKMQFQANFFNLFNHANFGNPVGNLNSPDFGKSQFTIGNPRVTQLGLRFDF
jgi:hypothetical protein